MKRKLVGAIVLTPEMLKGQKHTPSPSPEILGSGVFTNILDMLRGNKPGMNDFKKLINNHGDATITSIVVARQEIDGAVQKLANFISLGKFEDAKKYYQYDKLFHLKMVITLSDRYTFSYEKIPAPIVTPPNVSGYETMSVPTKNTVLRDFLTNGLKLLGDAYWKYDAFNQNGGANCQKFLEGLLQGSGLLTPTIRSFIQQDVEILTKEIPQYMLSTTNTATNIKSLIQGLLGHGVKKHKKGKQHCSIQYGDGMWDAITSAGKAIGSAVKSGAKLAWDNREKIIEQGQKLAPKAVDFVKEKLKSTPAPTPAPAPAPTPVAPTSMPPVVVNVSNTNSRKKKRPVYYYEDEDDDEDEDNEEDIPPPRRRRGRQRGKQQSTEVSGAGALGSKKYMTLDAFMGVLQQQEQQQGDGILPLYSVRKQQQQQQQEKKPSFINQAINKVVEKRMQQQLQQQQQGEGKRSSVIAIHVPLSPYQRTKLARKCSYDTLSLSRDQCAQLENGNTLLVSKRDYNKIVKAQKDGKGCIISAKQANANPSQRQGRRRRRGNELSDEELKGRYNEFATQDQAYLKEDDM